MIILASGSPRRAKILAARGYVFEVVKTDAPEVSYPGDPERTVRENASAKAVAVKVDAASAASPALVLAADTIVWCAGKIYGKPRDLEEARQFLRELSGKTHQVYTGVSIIKQSSTLAPCSLLPAPSSLVDIAHVTFKKLSEKQIDDYVNLVHPTDRAGAYDIDDYGPLLIDHWEGSYENIMGLPIDKVAPFLI